MPARAAITQPVRKSPPLIMTGMNGLSSHLRQRMQMRKTRICKRDSFRKKTKSIPRLGHTHNMIYCAAVAATYNAEGNVECWSCSKCGKNFGDSAGTNPLTTVQAAINSANHKTTTPVCAPFFRSTASPFVRSPALRRTVRSSAPPASARCFPPSTDANRRSPCSRRPRGAVSFRKRRAEHGHFPHL